MGNIISGNSGHGIQVASTATNVDICGNTIGTGVSGTENLGNTLSGVALDSTAVTSNLKVGGVNNGEGNLIAYNVERGVRDFGSGAGNEINGNEVRNKGFNGIFSANAGVVIAKNLVRNNGGATYDGIRLSAAATDNKVYQNTVHENGDDGILVQGTGAMIKNNIFTNHNAAGGAAIDDTTGAATVNYNDYFNNTTNCSGCAPGQDLNSRTDDPDYENATGGVFTLKDTSLVINQGCDLDSACADPGDGAQPDMNGGLAGNFNPTAPDMGAFESNFTSSCPVVSNTADAGDGSLRDCIGFANGDPGPNTITFDAAVFTFGTTINLLSAYTPLTGGGDTIDGGNRDNVIIDGTEVGSGSGLTLDSNGNEIKNLTIQNFPGSGTDGMGIKILSGRQNNILDTLILTGNGESGVYARNDNDGTQILNSTISNSGDRGIEFFDSVWGCGNSVQSENVLISGNTISDNGVGVGSDGIQVVDFMSGTITNNTISGAVASSTWPSFPPRAPASPSPATPLCS